MPIYEYQCGACGHQFEEWQKISDPPVKKCPACSKRKVEKLVSMSSFHLKGGGWYADLYGSSNGRNKSEATKTSTAKADSKADSTATSKTESSSSASSTPSASTSTAGSSGSSSATSSAASSKG